MKIFRSNEIRKECFISVSIWWYYELKQNIVKHDKDYEWNDQNDVWSGRATAKTIWSVIMEDK